jgi:hypothetical protein
MTAIIKAGGILRIVGELVHAGSHNTDRHTDPSSTAYTQQPAAAKAHTCCCPEPTTVSKAGGVLWSMSCSLACATYSTGLVVATSLSSTSYMLSSMPPHPIHTASTNTGHLPRRVAPCAGRQ